MYQPVHASTPGCGAALRRLPFLSALLRHSLVCGPEQRIVLQQWPDGHHPDRGWDAVSSPTSVGIVPVRPLLQHKSLFRATDEAVPPQRREEGGATAAPRHIRMCPHEQLGTPPASSSQFLLQQKSPN